MKIAYLINQYPAISHTFVRREIQALEQLGVEVVRFSVRRHPAGLKDPEDQKELEKTHVLLEHGARGLAEALARWSLTRPAQLAKAAKRATELGLNSDRGVLYHGAYLAEACVLVEQLEKHGVQHVHAHFGTNSATVAMLAHELGGPPFSFTVHGPEEFDKPETIKLGEKIRASRFVAAISSFGRSQLWRRVPSTEWSKVHVVRCGLDASFLAKEPTPVPDVPRVVCVGRLHEQKGQALLVEAVARVAKSGTPIELVLVGGGELEEEIKAAVARHGIEKNVRFTGWASGDVVRREVEGGRAMVLPSFAEGLPVVIMEALALGRPVISTYVAGIPELVAPGECGWLCAAGSVEQLETALRECLAAPITKLNAMGHEGRRRVLAMHDIRVSAQRLKTLIEGGSLEDDGVAREEGSGERVVPANVVG
ncbi:glycosyltransferase [Sandaracinus amylolyticus]|uniref:glycosyltransferase n=1 Tax=Sandaracinus amylolyticus TaxID=927083 RepID=UPI001F2B0141|nr:glycosyltransferase [Sandaracinus amylolyticus]UJR80239.1 Glycosyltransferase involved in cell wall biosynthesis [Sandaracinus amylolyticus]